MDAQNQLPLLQLKFEGPEVPEGRILWDDLNQFVANFDLALERLIGALEVGSPRRRGRPAKSIRDLSALEVVAATPGSFGLSLDLRRTEPMLPTFDTGKRGLELLIEGLIAIGEDTSTAEILDRGVLIPLRDAARVLDRGIQTVQVVSSAEVGGKSFSFNQDVREKITRHIRQPQAALAVAEGRLLMADVLEDRLHCRLHPSVGEPVLCRFDDSLVNTVLTYLHRRYFVRVRGEATIDQFTNRIHLLTIHDIEAIEEPEEVSAPRVSVQAFWNPTVFDELAAEQGVNPVEEWDRLTVDWPEDTDFDEFLAAVRSGRQEE
jgi:hypothetical protein